MCMCNDHTFLALLNAYHALLECYRLQKLSTLEAERIAMIVASTAFVPNMECQEINRILMEELMATTKSYSIAVNLLKFVGI